MNFFSLPDSRPSLKVAENGFSFNFLNRSQYFGKSINWTDQRYGKLWNYNLQYLDFLRQSDIDFSIKHQLLNGIYSWLDFGKLQLEPYPASLRIMNVIRFLSVEQFSNGDSLTQHLYAEVSFLSTHLEYHLLGNHLLENGFALLIAGTIFQESSWFEKAKKLLRAELEEQILSDGAHFELSPMYHRIILFRILEALGYLEKNTPFYDFLQEKASRMLGWMKEMTFADGSMPHFNDSTEGIAFESNSLLRIAGGLGLEANMESKLGDSGYRKFENGNFQCIVDAGIIGPYYQPGHGHADIASFWLYVDSKPVFIEAGTSTYENNSRRAYERGTGAHNTVSINQLNQSDVYGAFRVGHRAKVDIQKEETNELIILHDGYKRTAGVNHKRAFKFETNSITITDEIVGGKKSIKAVAYFHLHPDVKVKENENGILLNNGLSCNFRGNDQLSVEEYDCAMGFNQLVKSRVIKVHFFEKLVTTLIR
ncbi:MAG: alginate lyase family protein [Fulvivirga sp.]